MKDWLIGISFVIVIIVSLYLMYEISYKNDIKLERELRQKSCVELLTEFEMDLRTCENKLIDAEAKAEYLRLQLRLK